jgi:DNA-binding response OmpR family regulator
MRASLLLVGDDSVLLHSLVELLQDLAQMKLAISSDAEAAIVEEPYDLVVLCQTVPEHVVRRLLTTAWMLVPSPAIMVIDGSEEHRRLGALTYSAQLPDPGRLHGAVSALLRSTNADYGFLVHLRSPKEVLHYVVASTVEIQGEHLTFVNSEGNLTATFMVDGVRSWNVLRKCDAPGSLTPRAI